MCLSLPPPPTWLHIQSFSFLSVCAAETTVGIFLKLQRPTAARGQAELKVWRDDEWRKWRYGHRASLREALRTSLLTDLCDLCFTLCLLLFSWCVGWICKPCLSQRLSRTHARTHTQHKIKLHSYNSCCRRPSGRTEPPYGTRADASANTLLFPLA